MARGVGTFVAAHPPKPDPAAAAARIEGLAQQLIAMAATKGVDAAAVARRVLDLTKPLANQSPPGKTPQGKSQTREAAENQKEGAP
jgi:hypothetical protein